MRKSTYGSPSRDESGTAPDCHLRRVGVREIDRLSRDGIRNAASVAASRSVGQENPRRAKGTSSRANPRLIRPARRVASALAVTRSYASGLSCLSRGQCYTTVLGWAPRARDQMLFRRLKPKTNAAKTMMAVVNTDT